ncbi:MAG TPA: 50S ribosomal protein L15 [Spirochaetota bacterium]|nr:50S ribosomal protein L15 [Spirochaetota bacterium]
MEMYSIKKPASHKRRKRIGCGNSSGHGKTSGKGNKGQNARTGVTIRANFEGGQMPITRRIPKRGFTNVFRSEFQIVNLGQIEKLGLSEVTIEDLKKAGIIKSDSLPVKVLGNGDISKAVKITADQFSASAKTKIEKTGGQALVRGM